MKDGIRHQTKKQVPTSEEDFYLLLRFDDTYTDNISANLLALCSGSPAPLDKHSATDDNII